MALSPYIANADNAAQPVDSDQGGVAARELRALKQKVNEIQTSVRPVVATGTGNALVAAGLPTVLVANRIYYVVTPAANTGAVTLTPGTGAAIPVRQSDGISEFLPGQIAANSILQLQYTGSVLKQISSSGVQITPRQFDLPGLISAAEMGANTWFVTWQPAFPVPVQLAIFHNVYFDGTDYRYVEAATSTFAVQWIEGAQQTLDLGEGAAGDIIPAALFTAITKISNTRIVGNLEIYGQTERYIESTVNLNEFVFSDSWDPEFEDRMVYEFTASAENVGRGIIALGGTYNPVTLNGYPLRMFLTGQMPGLSTPVELPAQILQPGVRYRAMFQAAGGTVPEDRFVLLPPDGGWDVWDIFQLTPGGAVPNTATTIYSGRNRFQAIRFGLSGSPASIIFNHADEGTAADTTKLHWYDLGQNVEAEDSLLVKTFKCYHLAEIAEYVDLVEVISKRKIDMDTYITKRPASVAARYRLQVNISVPIVAGNRPQYLMMNFKC